MQKSILLFIFFILGVFYSNAQVTNPRHPAEWEEVRGVIMGGDYYSQYSLPLIYEDGLDPYVKVAQACIAEGIHFYLYDPDTSLSLNTFHNWDTCFANRGLVSPYIHIIKPQNLSGYGTFPWVRDFGPNCVYKNAVDTMYLQSYNALPNLLNSISDSLDASYAITPVLGPTGTGYRDGGNWLTDGHGTFNICNSGTAGLSIGLINPAYPDFKDYFGFSKTLNVTGVDIHADYWLKMIDEETFVVSYIPSTNYLGFPYDLNTNLQAGIDNDVNLIKANLTSVFGRSFKFIPIQNAPTYDNININTTYGTYAASYTNSLILNKTVLVPQYRSEPTDSLALKAYKEAMPGYNVIGVQCRNYALAVGALHCITKEIYAKDPIYMKHMWYKDTITNLGSYPVSVVANSIKGINTVKLYWTTNPQSGFQSITMTAGSNNTYIANIPGQPDMTKIYYYINATDMASKTIAKPFIAPASYYSFVVKGPTALPTLNLENQISMYPNPSNGNIVIANKSNAQLDITVCSSLGNIVANIKSNGKEYQQIDFNKLGISKGTYFISFQNANTKFTKKLIYRN